MKYKMSEDYYTILGVHKSASLQEINKAYRKLSIECHPDRFPENERPAVNAKFIKINKAKEILSDPEKRRIYDLGGEKGLSQHNEEMQHKRSSMKLQQMQVQVECTIFELYQGSHKKIEFKRIIIDGDINNPRTFHKVSEENTSIEIDLPAGLKLNNNLVIEYQGMKHIKEDIYGDLVINIVRSKVIPEEEKNYSFDNDKLHYRLSLSLKESLLGFSHTFMLPSKEKITIHNDSITRETSKVVKNIIVDISVALPTSLSPEIKEGLSKLFNYKLDKIEDKSLKIDNLKTYKEEQSNPNFMGFNMGNIGNIGNMGNMNMGNSSTQCVHQ